MFFFLSFCFPCFVLLFLCFLVRGGVNEEGKGAGREREKARERYLGTQKRVRDNTENQFTYRLYQMTKENSAINTHYNLICSDCYLSGCSE